MTEENVSAAPAAFLSSLATDGEVFDFRSGPFPAVVSAWHRSRLQLEDGGTHFGCVRQGRANLCTTSGEFELASGMYFAAVGPATIDGEGDGFVTTLAAHRGFFQIGGPIEEVGRLRYIDGCSDSLLIAPIMRGDPCLNLLRIPPRTNQTPHTHPSLRVGMIVDGRGICRTTDDQVSLVPGMVFAIRPGGLHSFHTSEVPLRIIAWHPDSDFGPTHEEHPMLNRTFVQGRQVNEGAQGDRR